jgi:hypothetical protein
MPPRRSTATDCILRHDLDLSRHCPVAGKEEGVELDHGFLAFGHKADVLVLENIATVRRGYQVLDSIH